MSNYFTRDEFVKPAPRRFHEFEATLNGETKTVRIQSLTALERSKYELGNLSSDGKWSDEKTHQMAALLVAMCVVDETGQAMLSADDVGALLKQDGAFVNDIYDECMDHTGLRARSLRRMAKNSSAGGETATPAA